MINFLFQLDPMSNGDYEELFGFDAAIIHVSENYFDVFLKEFMKKKRQKFGIVFGDSSGAHGKTNSY